MEYTYECGDALRRVVSESELGLAGSWLSRLNALITRGRVIVPGRLAAPRD